MIFPSASKQYVKEKTSASWDDYTRLSFINCMREEKATAKTIGENGFTSQNWNNITAKFNICKI